MRGKFLDFGWFQQIVMFWVEWDSLHSIGVAETFAALSSLKTSTKKVTNWNGINSEPNGANYFGGFQCILSYLDVDMLHICPCSPGCMNINTMREMQEWQLTRQEYRQTIETEVFSWDSRNYWSDNNFFSLGWWKKFYPASRPRYTRFWPSTDVSVGHGPDGHKFALCTLILTDRLEQVVHNRTDGRVEYVLVLGTPMTATIPTQEAKYMWYRAHCTVVLRWQRMWLNAASLRSETCGLIHGY